MLNVLSVDVEEYFHPTEVQAFVNSAGWSSLPSRVDKEVASILELFARYNVRATFFIVGWVAERNTRMVRQIFEGGHEIGCHSYSHGLVYDMSPMEFRLDTERCMNVIADACGVVPRVYRAPSYSITEKSTWALDVLADLGFTHDSSIYPVVHDRYGIPGFPRHAHIIKTPSGPICEVPIGTAELRNGRIAPIGGGGYLRLLPYRYTAAGIRRVNEREQQPACIYFHPWEVDAGQPQLAQGWIARKRTYTGIGGMLHKIEKLLKEFEFSTLSAVHAGPTAETRAVTEAVC
jgi:polysaccharide deacetylase family protein (PEP-CTERM system associated)